MLGRKPGPPDAEKQQRSPRALSALKNRNYRWYWFSGLGQSGAQGINQLTVAWLVLDLTGSVGQLGLVIFFQGLPTVIIALFGGVFADRYSRHKLLMWTQGFTTLVLAALAALSISDLVEVWMVYVVSILLGGSMSLTLPARNALIRSLVPIEQTMNAVALNSMQQQASRVVWPSLAGGMIAFLGVGVTIGFSAVISGLGMLSLAVLTGIKEDRFSGGATVIRELFDGIRYAFTTPRLNRIIILALSIGAFGLAYMTIGPGFAREELHFSASETGFFMMSSGVGAIIGSTILLTIDLKNQHLAFVMTAILFAFTLIALAVNPYAPLAFVFMALFGVSTTSLAITAQTIFQTTVPPQYLGRVTSFFSVGGGIGQMTALPIGLVGDQIGLRWPLGAVAVILLVIIAVMGPEKRAKDPASSQPLASES